MALPPNWWIYHGMRHAPDPDVIELLPAPPPWRNFCHDLIDRVPEEAEPAHTFRAPDHESNDAARVELELINAAILLRRPLLVTGKPGCGKTSLAKSIAWELALGKLLVWPINTRSTITEGLYHYDAIARLQDASLRSRDTDATADPPEIAKYLRLGPLGEALLPTKRPRVLLIDEIDKSDVDLPNDLLHVFEEGQFEIPELTRLKGSGTYLAVGVGDRGEQVPLPAGIVRCNAFPIIVLTSNGEREFPPAFLRRCVQLSMNEPDEDRLRRIIEAHLLGEDTSKYDELIRKFLRRRQSQTLSTDQLLNAVYLATRGVDVQAREALINRLLGGISDGVQGAG